MENELVELYKAMDGKGGSFGFNFKDHLPIDSVSIKYIGWEKRISTDYFWDGLNRGDESNCVFQYTLSGYGALEIGQTIHYVHPGEAFIVKIPSDHRYYLPPQSEKWEFVFITLQGKQAEKCWEDLYNEIGPILRINPDSKLINLLFRIYRETKNGNITDAYHVSARGYEFIMECYRFSKKLEGDHTLPKNLEQAISFIEANFDTPITLDDIARASCLSKYRLIKTFKEHLNITPIRYLTKVRIQHATHLLLNTDLSVKEISSKVGFSNDNYFNKVFRKRVGISAGVYRKWKTSIFFD